MKNIIFLILLIANFSYSQFQINVLNLKTNDLVFDNNSNKVFASIPSSNGSNGNSLGIINPINFQLQNTIFIGSEPSALAISDNGQYIYSGFNTSSTVRRFNVATLTPELQFSLGSDSFLGAYYVDDIEVMPGSPNTIAIARRNNGFSPRHMGVVIYDNNIKRPNTTQVHTGSNKIEFVDNQFLYGYNNESTEFGLRKLLVDSQGVSEINVTANIITNFYNDFVYRNNLIYASNGQVADVSSSEPFLIGQFANTSGAVAYDLESNLVCFASYDWNGNIIFKRFNPNTFLLVDSIEITQVNGSVKSLIKSGSGCYTFNTEDNVVIINAPVLSTKLDSTLNIISIFPNPTKDIFTINSKEEYSSIQLIDINSRVVVDLDSKQKTFDISSLNNGIYFVKTLNKEGITSINKLIKN